MRGMKKIFPKAISNTPHASIALPNILNIYFPGCKAEELLTRFDLDGVAVSAGSACASRSSEASHVLRSLGYSEEHAKASIRFSFGRFTEKEEVKRALGAAAKIFKGNKK
jgi:cysteine desulfurase